MSHIHHNVNSKDMEKQLLGFVAPLGCSMNRPRPQKLVLCTCSSLHKTLTYSLFSPLHKKGNRWPKRRYLFIFSAFQEQTHRYFPHAVHTANNHKISFHIHLQDDHIEPLKLQSEENTSAFKVITETMGTEICISPLSHRDKTNGNSIWKTTYLIESFHRNTILVFLPLSRISCCPGFSRNRVNFLLSRCYSVAF